MRTAKLVEIRQIVSLMWLMTFVINIFWIKNYLCFFNNISLPLLRDKAQNCDFEKQVLLSKRHRHLVISYLEIASFVLVHRIIIVFDANICKNYCFRAEKHTNA